MENAHVLYRAVVTAHRLRARRHDAALVALTSCVLMLAGCAHSTTPNIAGVWKVTYGAPSEVTIRATKNHAYVMTAKTPVTVVTSTCLLPRGTTIAQFSGKGSSYSGQHGLWNTQSCAFVTQTNLRVTLRGDTAVEALGNGDSRTLTRVSAGAGDKDAWLWLLVALIVVAIACHAVLRRRRQTRPPEPAFTVWGKDLSPDSVRDPRL